MTRLIDAEALNDEMYHKSFEVDDGRNVWNSGLWIRYKIFEEAIRDAPTVDAAPVRHGKWIDDGQEGSVVTSYSYHCSECGESLHLLSVAPYKPCQPYKFCPHCGARMDAEE